MKQKILKCGVISWVILIAIWGLGSLGYDEYFLPSPAETIAGVKELILNGALWIDIIASISRVLRGWLLAVVLGVPLGLLVGNFKAVRFIIEPILSFFRFVPAIALTTLFLMWFGVGDESKIALIFYASFFPIFINTIAGVVSTDHSYIEAASCMGANRIRVFFTVVVPSAVLGYLINSSKLYYKTGWAFAGILTLAVIGFLSDRLVQFIGIKKLAHFGVK